jgi:hypothetical protein
MSFPFPALSSDLATVRLAQSSILQLCIPLSTFVGELDRLQIKVHRLRP